MPLPRDFKDLLRSLGSRGVKYLLLGGYAVAYHGYPRPTGDIDLWIEPTPENAKRVISALEEFGGVGDGLAVEHVLDPQGFLRMGMPPLRVEIMPAVSGLEFPECYERRVVVQVDDITVTLISLADLRINKRASGRYKDLADLDYLPE